MYCVPKDILFPLYHILCMARVAIFLSVIYGLGSINGLLERGCLTDM